MTPDTRIAADLLAAFIIRVLGAAGLSQQDAEIVAGLMVPGAVIEIVAYAHLGKSA